MKMMRLKMSGWLATCHAIKDRLLDRFMKTQREHNKSQVRRAYYLSMEYLMGRLLTNNLYNSGYHDMVRDVDEFRARL